MYIVHRDDTYMYIMTWLMSSSVELQQQGRIRDCMYINIYSYGTSSKHDIVEKRTVHVGRYYENILASSSARYCTSGCMLLNINICTLNFSKIELNKFGKCQCIQLY